MKIQDYKKGVDSGFMGLMKPVDQELLRIEMEANNEALELWRELLGKIESGEIPILVEAATAMCIFCGNTMWDCGDPTDAHGDDCIYVRAVHLVNDRLTGGNDGYKKNT